MSSLPFVAKITRDWRYPHRENAYQFAQRPPAGFQATEPPDWVTETVTGTIPGAAKVALTRDAEQEGYTPNGAVGSLFDDRE